MDELLEALLTANRLKAVSRSGWVLRGVPEAESVAEHTYGVAFVALALAEASDEGFAFDRGRLLTIALLHDLAESVIGDIPLPARRFLPPGAKQSAETAVMKEVMEAMPGGEGLLALWAEYAAGTSPEAQLVHDADRLEMLLQAYLYRAQTGNRALAEFWDGPAAREPFAFAASRQLFDALKERYTRQFPV